MSINLHAYIRVTDLERGIEFYCHTLGLQLRRHLSHNWAELKGAAIPIFILAQEPIEQQVGYWTVHLDFLTDDLELAVSKACEVGAVLVREIQERVYGRMANMVDPFGNPFDFIEMNSDGYDRIDFVKN